MTEMEVLRAERDAARRQVEHAVKILAAIHRLLFPPRVTVGDGTAYEFNPDNPREYMQALSDAIRAIPDQLPACDPTATQCPRCNNPNGPKLGSCAFDAPARPDYETRLRQWIEARIQGGCKVISLGWDGCTCPLCDFDRMSEAARRAK